MIKLKKRGNLSPAATTKEQTAMFAFGKKYLDALGYKRLSFCHWARNNRERSLYNTMARIADRIQAQMNQCRLDIAGLGQEYPKLAALAWLGGLWEDYGLWQDNGWVYQLTEAGQFWQVNMTQTILECVEYLLSGKNGIVDDKIAQQG